MTEIGKIPNSSLDSNDSSQNCSMITKILSMPLTRLPSVIQNRLYKPPGQYILAPNQGIVAEGQNNTELFWIKIRMFFFPYDHVYIYLPKTFQRFEPKPLAIIYMRPWVP